MTTSTIEGQCSMSKMGLHIGTSLMDKAAKYDTLVLTALEGIQNAIDAEATTVFVGFDLKDRIAVIADNGVGADQEQFEAALATVGRSQKLRKPGKLGQFGIGVISPLDKCTYFEFISTPRGGPTKAWSFAQAAIENSEVVPDIPMVVLPDGMPTLEAAFEPEAKKLGVSWNTIVRMYGITKDRVVSKLSCSKLADEITTRFGDAMRDTNTVCHIFIRDTTGRLHRATVKPFEYTGDPIEGSPFIITGDQAGTAGKITIELYRAVLKNGKRQGEIKVAEGQGAPSGISLESFLAQAKDDLGYAPKDGLDELTSGYFEGLILVENLKLHPDRKRFLKKDPLMDSVIALDSWYENTGRQNYHGERDRDRNDRYRDLTNLALDQITAILRRPEHEEFRQGIRENVQFGLIGSGHGQKPEEGTDADRTTRRKPEDQDPKQPKKKPIICPPGERGTRDGDMPFGQIDPSGRRRSMVGSDSIGLWIEVAEFELSNDLWRYDQTTGKLTFNCSNDVWADLDGTSSARRMKYNDQWIVSLQKWVITQVLLMLQLPLEQRERFAAESRNSARLYADMVIKSNKTALPQDKVT